MRAWRLISFLLLLVLLVTQCNEPPAENVIAVAKKDSLFYLNLADSAKYLGINSCKSCHQEIYNSYIKTGMGKSFGHASKSKSVADYSNSSLYDKFTDLHYKSFWKNDSLFFCEFRLSERDTSFKRTEHVNYIIGSGQHTNSHLQTVNGYINQMPMTFYSQKHKWDLPPGFENGYNTRFTRKIGLECMSCHNAYPDFVLGSENKYNAIPEGINCERCHGPGSIHVAQRSAGNLVDTSKYIDYSIVNPAKLAIDRQFDLCQRCHLQGNAVLKEGKSFYDFKPGMKLSDYITVFLPKYKNSDDEFIMASHADRLKQSQCFIKTHEIATANSGSKTNAVTNSLKPYKSALTCITCHNPHVSVKETNTDIFNAACNDCHGKNKKSKLWCVEKSVLKSVKSANCVKCHMPSSGSSDIPHVTVHDHYIRKPITKLEKGKIKAFMGLYAINEKNPSSLTRAWAYINQYSKFDAKPEFLDSAKALLSDRTKEDLLKNMFALFTLNFAKQNFKQIIDYVDRIGENQLFGILSIQSYDNLHAWCAYHVAESFLNTGKNATTIKWFAKAVELAPYNLEFHNKLGTAFMNSGKSDEAINEFEFIINENPKYIAAYTNLGFIALKNNDIQKAEELYNKALLIDSDSEPLLMNIAGLKAYKKDYKGAIDVISKILKRSPDNQKAKLILGQLKSRV